MKRSWSPLGTIGGTILLLLRVLRHLPTLPRQIPRLVDQCFQIGWSTVPIIVILSFFIGAVLALQTGDSMRGFGGFKVFIGSIVGLSLAKELGPVMGAFLLVGRVGSAMTAELASMKVYQEVDALKTMNIPAERILVLPRIAAVVLMMPLLTAIAIVVGWVGGATVAEYVGFIELSPDIYWRSLRETVNFDIFLDGLIKGELFGIFIVLLCCHTGLSTSGGPREIGGAVTKAVVISMIFILIADYFITRVLL